MGLLADMAYKLEKRLEAKELYKKELQARLRQTRIDLENQQKLNDQLRDAIWIFENK